MKAFVYRMYMYWRSGNMCYYAHTKRLYTYSYTRDSVPVGVPISFSFES